MTKADEIRRMASEGLGTSEIAARLGIRYQHAYNVLMRSKIASPKAAVATAIKAAKPVLHTDTLLAAGFSHGARWIVDEQGVLKLDIALPKTVGVYAFAKDGVVLYVGVATMGLAKRLYFYARPGISQKTSLRLHAMLKEELIKVSHIDILVATPADLEWNGLPVHGSAGLELGLIKKYALPWNMRSAG